MPTLIRRKTKINDLQLDQKVYSDLIESVKSGIYMAHNHTDNLSQLFFSEILLGYDSKEELLGHNLAKELYVDSRDREEFLKRIIEKDYLCGYEVRLKRKNGSTVILSGCSNVIKNNHGEILGVQGVVSDVTEEKRLKKDLEVEKVKLEQIVGFDEKVSSIRKVDKLYDFIVEKILEILEAEKCSLMISDHGQGELCLKAFKGIEDKIINKTRIKLGEQLAGIVARDGKPLLVRDIENDSRFQRQNRISYRNKSFIIAPITVDHRVIGVINVADKKGKPEGGIFTKMDLKILCMLAREVAVAVENIRLYKELKYLTVTDPLTHINNYRFFTKEIDSEIRRRKRTAKDLTLLMIDIDDFKLYNDSFGHLDGDVLLQKIGHVLTNTVRETDVVCRYAGDEFSVILPETSKDGARVVAEKIQKSMGEAHFKRKVTLSIGIAKFTSGMSRHDFVAKTDRALYQAKKDGKNRICIY